MPVITEHARAKINLTLNVLGRRPDGYHELVSLVAFAGAGDIVTLDPDRPAGAEVGGRFAAGIASRNLVAVTLDLLRQAEPRLRLGRVHLEKRLPVAAGIGGGSADGAAVLRAVRQANPELADRLGWRALAVRLGADVAVCLENRAAWVEGVGDKVAPLAEPLPPLDAVLVNPLVAVPADKTARVFRALDRAPLEASRHWKGGESDFRSRADLMALMRRRGNDLEAAARAVVPAIADVMEALGDLPGLEIAGLSGAGPTCFGIFSSQDAARTAAASLRAAHPGWWIEPTILA